MMIRYKMFANYMYILALNSILCDCFNDELTKSRGWNNLVQVASDY